MKRTPLARTAPLQRGGGLSRSPIKRTAAKPKKKKKTTITQAKKKAWTVFSRYIRKRGAWQLPSGQWVNYCVTCREQRPITGVGCLQAGHFIAGRGNAVLYNETCVHPQCYVCNVRKSGMWVEYDEFMRETYGDDETDVIKRLRFAVHKRSVLDHQDVEAYFKKKLEEIGGWPE